MTTTQAVETSVSNNSLSKDYPQPDDQANNLSILLLYFLFLKGWEDKVTGFVASLSSSMTIVEIQFRM